MKVLLLKELKDSFGSAWIYSLSAVFNGVVGWMFFSRLVALQSSANPGLEKDVLFPLVGNINFLLFMICPILCMRSFSEEKNIGSIHLLYLSRLKDIHIFTAKFLSALMQSLFLLSFSLVVPLILILSGYDNFGLLFSQYLGLFYCLLIYISVSMSCSLLSSNSLVCLLSSYGLLFLSFLISLAGQLTTNLILKDMIAYATLVNHVETAFRGVFISYDFIYLVSFVFFFFILSLKFMESRKW